MMHDLEFKPFHETYKIISFSLCVSLMYPNPKNEKKRIAAILLLIAGVAPISSLAVIDIYKCVLEKDFVNIIKHSTVMGPFSFSFVKMLLMFYKRVQVKQIIDEITGDYLFFNNCDQKYKDLVKSVIRNSKIWSETSWSIIIIICGLTYPTMAILLNTHSFLFADEPTLHMIHDFQIINMEPEARFKSPCYELLFIYMSFCALIFTISYIGYDGFFGIAINHARLKIECSCAALEEAMRGDCRDVYWKMVCVIREQCKMFKFVSLIQDTFNIWLGAIFTATFIQICTSLYHITETIGVDVVHLIFLVGALIHIYVPCRYAAELKESSLKTADKIYSCGWQNVHNNEARKLIITMIARAQVPTQIVAFDMINFNMELFASILQTSYSMFTLLES